MELNAAGSGPLIEEPATLEEWKRKAEALWSLLDDISTAGDMFKPEITNYFKYVNMKCEERSKYMQSDGYFIVNVKNDDSSACVFNDEKGIIHKSEGEIDPRGIFDGST